MYFVYLVSYFSGDRVFNITTRSYGYNLHCVTSTVVATVDLDWFDWFDSHFIFASGALRLGFNNMFVLKELQVP